MSFIRTDKISYRYPVYEDPDNAEYEEIPVDALSGIDLNIEKGQFICILGSNGSGKSTLARHLNALLLPNEGTVWIDGMDSKDSNYIWDIRSKIGMVFQNPDNQIVSSKVDEEVAFGLENLGVPSLEIQKNVKEALKSVGMEAFETENPYNLSGGQKQRVAVAGILAMKPQCIVLDESTAMLDPRGRKEIMDTVLKLNKEMGITLICITHFMEEAAQADHIIVMNHGKISLEGSPREIFSHAEEIKAADLKLPIICELAERLRKKGVAVPSDIITADELKTFLLSLKNRS